MIRPVAAALATALTLVAAAAARTQEEGEPGKVFIVTINLREGFYGGGDLDDMSEVSTFVRRLLDELTRDPDVLLLQEVNSKSTHKVARVLSTRTGDRYTVAQDAGERAFWQKKGRVYKADTAIVINNRTMREAGKSGYITSIFDPKKGMTEYKKSARALVRLRSTGLEIGLTSLHIPKGAGYTSRIKKIEQALRSAYPSAGGARFYAIGGDFNSGGVHTGDSFGQIVTKRWWRWITGPADYNDAIYNVTREKGVDYVFVRGGVLDAGLDPRPAKYSDHRFRWAKVGPDRTPPTVPSGVDARSFQTGPPRIKVMWSRSNDAEAGVWEYDVWRSNDGTDFKRIGSTANDAYYDEAVTDGEQYWYYVVAKDYSDNRSAPSETVSQVAGDGP
jgi:hypothetical protein